MAITFDVGKFWNCNPYYGSFDISNKQKTFFCMGEFLEVFLSI